MLKRFLGAARTCAAAACLFAVALVAAPVATELVLAVPAAAQEVVVAAPAASVWDSFWAAVQAPLLAVFTAVATWLGVIITAKVREFLGERAALAFNQVYQLGIDQAAGWYRQRTSAGATLVTSPGSLQEAVNYFRQSYPKAAAAEPDDDNVASDILATLGRLGPLVGKG